MHTAQCTLSLMATSIISRPVLFTSFIILLLSLDQNLPVKCWTSVPLAPEHICVAVLFLYRRRQTTTQRKSLTQPDMQNERVNDDGRWTGGETRLVLGRARCGSIHFCDALRQHQQSVIMLLWLKRNSIRLELNRK